MYPVSDFPSCKYVILPAVLIDQLLVGERDLEDLDSPMITVLFVLRDLHDNHGIIPSTFHYEFVFFAIPLSHAIFERNLLLYLAGNIKACGTMVSKNR